LSPERLTKGYHAFIEGRFAVERGRYQQLAGQGQSPSIMVIGCVDSRVSPEVTAAITAPREDEEGYLRQLEFASVELSLKNLMTFPFVKLAVEEGTLRLHGAYFGVASGKLLVRDEATGSFEPV
jgi:carbonic anhydrase